MKLHEHAKNYYTISFIGFEYITGLSGYVCFVDGDGTYYKRSCYADEDGRFKMGSFEEVNQQYIDSFVEPIRQKINFDKVDIYPNGEENEQLVKSVQIRLTEFQYNRLKKISKSCGIKPSTYIRNLINNDIINMDLEDAKGYSII